MRKPIMAGSLFTTKELVTALVVLIVIAVIGITVLGVVSSIRRKLRDFSRAAFGTDSFTEGLNKQADELARTPKSVASMTRLMEPQIMRDFPDFSWNEFKHKAENMLVSALLAIAAENPDRLVEASEDVRKQIVNRIEANKAAGARETYSDIHIHQTEIANYRHAQGKCVITIQSAVEYYHYRTKDGSIIEGQKERKEQTKYNIELIYIQDEDAVEFDNAVGTTCPHCGAPVKSLGRMVCEYCGSGITPINIKVWSLHKFYEVDYNHI